MTIKNLLVFTLVLGLFAIIPNSLNAQDEGADASATAGIQATPKHGLEVGLHGGHFFSLRRRTMESKLGSWHPL